MATVEEGESPHIINISLGSSKEKYSGMGSAPQSPSSTLDEAVLSTIKRDLVMIYKKVLTVFLSKSDESKLDELRKNWDLWGPLVITLSIAALVTLGSYGKAEELFTNLFVTLWLGPAIISLNCRLLGAKVAIIQSICLIMYCTAPILVLSLGIFLIRLAIHSFLLNLLLSTVAVVFTVRGTHIYFGSLVRADRKFLVLYPIALFYVFLAVYISMA